MSTRTYITVNLICQGLLKCIDSLNENIFFSINRKRTCQSIFPLVLRFSVSGYIGYSFGFTAPDSYCSDFSVLNEIVMTTSPHEHKKPLSPIYHKKHF